MKRFCSDSVISTTILFGDAWLP